MDDDLFSTEEYANTSAVSCIAPPLLPTFPATGPGPAPQARPRQRPSKFHPHSQQVSILAGKTCEGSVLSPELISSDRFVLPMEGEPTSSCLDYFSQAALRDDLLSLLASTGSFNADRLREARHEADPYGFLRESSLFQYPKALLMANLSALFPALISQKNFLIPSYNFVTICDKGGFAEVIQKRYSDVNVSMGEISGWALFPRREIRVTGVTAMADKELNFASLQRKLDEVYAASDSVLGQSVTLLATDFSVKHPSPTRRERLMKLYICYSLYAAFRLLCKDGNLVLKLYSTFQPGTNECIYLLYRHFASVCVVKPFGSRSASSCKFVVCEGFDGSGQETEALAELCRVMERLHKMDKDLEHIMELSQVTKSAEFLNYMLEINKQVSSYQIARVKEVVDFLTQEEKPLPNKRDIAERCLVEWGLKQVERPDEHSSSQLATAHRPSTSSTPFSSHTEHRVADLSKFKGIIDRVSDQGPRFTPMTRFGQEGEDRNEYLASFSNERKDAILRSAKLLEQKTKKPPKRPANSGDSPKPKKRQKNHSKK